MRKLALLFFLVLICEFAHAQTPGFSVNSINGISGPFTFTGGGVSCTGTTCTFSGGGSGITALTQDVTASGNGSVAATVVGINDVLLSGLANGPYYFTAGVPTVETAAQAIAALGSTPAINCSSCTSIPAAAAGSLTGTTLASNVVTSSLTSAAGGSFGTAAYVAIGTSGATLPLLSTANTWSLLQTLSAGASVASGQVLNWNSDTGLSRASAGVLDCGNGTNGSTSCTIQASIFSAGSGINVASSGEAVASNLGILWSSTTAASGTKDTTICRNAAGVVEIGASTTCAANGTVVSALLLPGLKYSAAGTPLATCASGIVGEEAVVSDATALTPGTAYTTGGGADTVRVQCAYTGSVYGWQTM